jgi:hypothetical protein
MGGGHAGHVVEARRAADARHLSAKMRARVDVLQRARRFWKEDECSLVESGCSSAVEHEAIEALAIHHEHRRRDLEAARLFAMENVVRARKGARHRLDRIERKLAGGGGRLL